MVELLVIATVTLIAAVIGGIFVWAVEIWREMTAAVSACKILFYELHTNVVRIHFALSPSASPAARLQSTAWEELSVRAAPVLHPRALNRVSSEYGFLPQAQHHLENLDDLVSQNSIVDACSDLQTASAELDRVIHMSRLTHFWRLASGRSWQYVSPLTEKQKTAIREKTVTQMEAFRQRRADEARATSHDVPIDE